MKAPVVPEAPVDLLAPDDLRRLLAHVKGKDFVSRRDTAIVMLFTDTDTDTGVRLAEMAGLTLADLDLDDNVAYVVGKGRRARACPFGAATAAALDRYLRARAGIPAPPT